MQESTYYNLFKYEDTLWRSVANRKMIKIFWIKYRKKKLKFRILDLGCGGGGTLKFFKSYGETFGLDNTFLALKLCQRRKLQKIVQGNLILLPYKEKSFDLVSAIDVIEHIKQDWLAFKEIYRIISNKGILITIIPAFQFLWSERDIRLAHFKRYKIKEIKKLAENAGFKVLKCSYINLFYFPLLAGIVTLKRVFYKIAPIKTDVATVPDVINWILEKLLNIESFVLKSINFPFGCSTILIAQKM